MANVGTVEWDGILPASVVLREGDELQYVLRAIAPDGNVDETFPNRIQMVRPEEVQRSLNQLAGSAVGSFPGMSASQLLERDLQSAVNGVSNLRQQNIQIYGSRVRVHWPGHPGRHAGQDQRRELSRSTSSASSSAEFLLPVGRHSFDVETGTGDQVAHRQLDIDVTGKYFFMVGLADITVSDNSIGGSVAPVDLNDNYDDMLTEGRLAFYLKGKIQGKYLITAQADTTERDIERPVQRASWTRTRATSSAASIPTSTTRCTATTRPPTATSTPRAACTCASTGTRTRRCGATSPPVCTGSEFSQYVRSLYGAAISWRTAGSTALGEAEGEVRAFGSEAQNAPGHTEFLGTGGSLYYLRHSDLLPGSDRVTVEVRDPLTGRVENRIDLIRGIDYEIDELQGRVLLTRPLSQIVRDNLPTITRDQPLDGFDNILLVDYEYVPTGFDTDQLTAGISGKRLARRSHRDRWHLRR